MHQAYFSLESEYKDYYHQCFVEAFEGLLVDKTLRRSRFSVVRIDVVALEGVKLVIVLPINRLAIAFQEPPQINLHGRQDLLLKLLLDALVAPNILAQPNAVFLHKIKIRIEALLFNRLKYRGLWYL